MKNWAFNPVVRLAVAVWALGAACSAWATGPWYVAMSGSGLDGLSWGTAYTNVQTAINAAADGDTIYLKGETFTLPVNNANGKLIWQSKTLTIDGGYAGTVGQAPGSVNGTNTTLQNTTAYSGDDLTKRVLYVSYVTNGLMRRVTVSGGSCSAGYQNNGGAGMYLANSPGMTLDSCQLVGNFFRIHDGSYETRGGGVYVNNSSAIFSNCVLQQNSTSLANNDYSRGGAIYLLSGSLTLVHSILYGNAAQMESTYTKTAQGGAIYVAGGILNLRDCLLYGNAANPGYPSGTSYAAVNQGDGIYAGGGTTVLQNCTVAYQPDDGVYQTGAAIVAITNSILWGNSDDIVGTVSLGSCDIENGDNKGTNGCFSANPLFEYGYYLGAGSPCTNAGSVSAAQAGVDSRTTRTDGTFDTHAAVDLGYHYPTGFDLTYADIYAATNGVDSNLGTNASAAYRTITNAFAHAQHGSRVHLAAGTYSTESWPLVLSDKVGVQILGASPTNTILNAPGVWDNDKPRVMSLNRLTGETLLSGLRLQGGRRSNRGDGFGGGLFMSLCSRVTVTNCAFVDNWASDWPSGGRGGGAYSQLGSVTYRNCQFERNRIRGGSEGGAVTLYGGGVFAFGGSGRALVQGSTIVSNSVDLEDQTLAQGCGGGAATLGNMTVRNCLVIGNEANFNRPLQNGRGDGLGVGAGAMWVENCTVANNLGVGIERLAGAMVATNCILWNNGTDATGVMTVAYSDVGVAATNVATNACISANPQFVNAATNNFQLLGASPAINRGALLGWMTGALDLNGQARVQGTAPDLGAYEYPMPTGADLPELNNLPGVTNLLATSAFLNGNLTATGGSPTYVWAFWDTNNWGASKTWAGSYNFGGLPQSTGVLTYQATNLLLNTSYYYTYYASNAAGREAWGWDGPSGFKTKASPTLGNTNGATSIQSRSAVLNGTLTGGSSANILIYWWVNQSSVTNTLDFGQTPLLEGGFSTNLTGLLTGTMYWYQCFASNAYGTATSIATNFTTYSGLWYAALTGGSAPCDGSSWAHPFTNVQTAIDAAWNGDTIYLKGETFTLPLNNANGKLIWQGKGLTLAGGYAGTIGQTPGGLAGTTTLLNTRASTQGENPYNRVLYINGVTNGVLRRVTVSGGNFSYAVDDGGAGLQIANSPGFVVDGCIVRNNATLQYNCVSSLGGGVDVIASTVTFTNCALLQNTAGGNNLNSIRGGAICLLSGGITVLDSSLYGNLVDSAGNRAAQSTYGGAIYVGGGNALLRNCLLYGNSADPGALGNDGISPNFGDAIYAEGSSTTRLENCTVAYQPDDGVYQSGAAVVSITNSILWGNGDDIVGAVSLGYCNIENGDSLGSNGCISEDPKFEFGYYLGAASTSVNRGSKSADAAGLSARTTRTDGTPDTHAAVDLGYHYAVSFDTSLADIYVDSASGLDTNIGTNASFPFKTLTNSFAQARDGTRIHLAAGNYTAADTGAGQLWWLGDKVGLQLLGAGRSSTILQWTGGDYSTGPRLMYVARLTGETRFSGLTFTGGRRNSGGTAGYGGALLITQCARMTFDNCAFVDNQGFDYWGSLCRGGAVYSEQSVVTFKNCNLERNRAVGNNDGIGGTSGPAYGGALYQMGGSGRMIVQESTIVSNSCTPKWSGAAGYGGGVFTHGAVYLRNCFLCGNEANTITNPAVGLGDGLYAASGTLLMDNCTVVTNLGSGIYGGGGTVAVTNCILWFNGMDATGAMTVAKSDIGVADANVTLVGCLSSDPLFVAPGNYRLSSSSPCRDKGTNLAWMVPGSVDLDAAPRIQGPRVDMGAYEAVFHSKGTVFIIQ